MKPKKKKGKVTRGITKRIKEIVRKNNGFPFIIPKTTKSKLG
jgi:hypothetical protein